MARNGLDFDPARQYEPCRYSMAEGYRAARRLLEREPGLTALFALGDVIALGPCGPWPTRACPCPATSRWWGMTAPPPPPTACPA